MKFLQTQANNQPIAPRVLELGVDCTRIETYYDKDDNPSFWLEDLNGDPICSLDDCYASKPLNEKGDECVFDVIEYDIPILCYEPYDRYIIPQDYDADKEIYDIYKYYEIYDSDRYYQHAVNKKSIFHPTNQTKYPELYKLVLEMVR